MYTRAAENGMTFSKNNSLNYLVSKFWNAHRKGVDPQGYYPGSIGLAWLEPLTKARNKVFQKYSGKGGRLVRWSEIDLLKAPIYF